jgi:hypothetical protein
VRLGHDGEVGTLREQGRQEFVDVAADTAAVRRDGGRVDEDPGCVRQDDS